MEEFWHVRAVADRLVNHQITKKATIISLVVDIILASIFWVVTLLLCYGPGLREKVIALTPSVLIPWGTPALWFMLFVGLILVSGLSLLLLFVADYQRKGKHFAVRWIHLARPLLVNLCVLGLMLQFTVTAGLNIFANRPDFVYGVIQKIALIMYLFFFWELNKWLKYTAQRAQGE